MKTTFQRALVALSLMLPAVVLAHDYDFVEGGYVNVDFDRGDDDAGLRLAGSLDLGEPLAVIGEYVDTGDFAHLTAGALFNTALDDALDLIGGFTLDHIDLPRDDDLGMGLRGGLRWLALHSGQNPGRLETGVELRHIFIFDDSVTSIRGNALFRIAEPLDVQVALQFGDDDRMELGLRYYFAARQGDRSDSL